MSRTPIAYRATTPGNHAIGCDRFEKNHREEE
jgi:hypothetical protein